MPFKKWIPGRDKRERVEVPEPELSIDDMIALEQFDDAERILNNKIKANLNDLHSQLKLAELYMKSGRRAKAVDEYVSIADAYAQDGFFDKAVALLAKVAKVAPGHEKVPMKIAALQRMKKLERRRGVVTDALLAGHRGAGGGVSAFKIQRMWRDLVNCPLIERLDEDRLRRLFTSVELTQFRPEETLVEADEKLDKLFIIAQGTIEAVFVLPNGSETVVRSFSPGQIIGDRALFEHQPWVTRYRCSEGGRVSVLELNQTGLMQAMQGDPDPREFLGLLRDQRSDQEVVASVHRLRRS